jgi:hypothetical protein
MSIIFYVYFNEKNLGHGGLRKTEREGGGYVRNKLETIDL